MYNAKYIIYIAILFTSPIVAQDRDPANTTQAERELALLMDELHNNNNNYREPNRNINSNSKR